MIENGMIEVVELDRAKPPLPRELLEFPLDEIDILDFPRQLEELWGDIFAELEDHRFVGRSHNSTGTYDKGCRGPLCRKSVRENDRRKKDIADQLTSGTYRRLDPIMEFYHMIAKLRIRNYRNYRLMTIKAG